MIPLQVFPRHPESPDTYYIDGAWAPACITAVDKRFSPGELAAEYWRLRLKVCASGNRDMKAKGHVCIEWQSAHDELDVMQRFMELPHHDADPA